MTKRAAALTTDPGTELALKKEATALASPPSMSRSTSRSMSTTTLPSLAMEGGAQDWCGISRVRHGGGWQKLAAAHHCRTPRYGIEDMQDAGDAPTRPRLGSMPGRGPALLDTSTSTTISTNTLDPLAVHVWCGDSPTGWQERNPA